MTFPPHSLELARHVLARCQARGFRLATAESCTGGLIAGCLTEIPGCSSVVDRGFVTYDDRAKKELLDVPTETLARGGAVSEETARAMAEGARTRAGVDLAIAVTGIAGPGGATAEKPVGLVHLAVAALSQPTRHRCLVLAGDRHAIRQASVDAALELALEALG